ncbi:precorrin-3B C(17)-methyltransferase [Rhodobacteraceae bacterium RKSG542]|uniref:cobalamin biosynthesis protein n=1 Tax=Pseudovibrio flavus TaxID=2529854 RepID=UPI0012BD025C|nr:cobalamin biosynthesis protein [Pseudovibrio flavus]MTI17705.1 precorrin-3B C(17)-methyltransferase [Pseudovibrio flavus]
MVSAPVIIVVSPSALPVARIVSALFEGALIHGYSRRSKLPVVDYHISFHDLSIHLQDLYEAETPIIGICGASSLIRALAPDLGDKAVEPPVLAISEDGECVVPLLGGHHGANALARKIAEGLESYAALTSAGEAVCGIALNEPPHGWTLANPRDAKGVMARLQAGETAVLRGECDWISESSLPLTSDADIELVASEYVETPCEGRLIYYPHTLVLGLDVEEGVGIAELELAVLKALEAERFAIGAVAAIVMDEKLADNAAINELSEKLHLPLRFYSQQERTAWQENRKLEQGVSEALALLGAGVSSRLVGSKQRNDAVSLAIAQASKPLDSEEIGRARGCLSVVGIGPGKECWRTPEASRWLAQADEIVGCAKHLDQVAPLIRGKQRHVFPSGAEHERASFALEHAGKGHNVALVCSGDAGVSNVSALIYDLISRSKDCGGVSDAASRVEIKAAPGISQVQALASLVGAPFAQGSCLIPALENDESVDAFLLKLEHALKGDYAIGMNALCAHLAKDKAAQITNLLLRYRDAEIPVVVGVNIGCEGQSIHVTPLSELNIAEVNEGASIIIASSLTQLSRECGGKRFLYTSKLDAGDQSADLPEAAQ